MFDAGSKKMTILTILNAAQLIQDQGTDIVIPETYTSIGSNAFRDLPLTSVVIPDGVTSIGSYAFDNNKLTSVVIPDGVFSI